MARVLGLVNRENGTGPHGVSTLGKELVSKLADEQMGFASRREAEGLISMNDSAGEHANLPEMISVMFRHRKSGSLATT